MTSTSALLKMRDERGPRWMVAGTIRRGEHIVRYADTAEDAERIHDGWQELGYYQLRITPPAGSVNLDALGRARQDAKAAFDEATSILRAGVLRALEEGRAEAEVARAAGVDRMTVRKWSGK